MAIRVVCQCSREIRAPDDLAGKTVKCPQCGRKVPIPGPVAQSPREAPSEDASRAATMDDAPRAWHERLRREALGVVPFYWSQRAAIRSVVGELVEPLRSESARQREIHLSAVDLEQQARRRDVGWALTLPECCVVCGELTDLPPRGETHRAWDLTWPCLLPPAMVSLGFLLSLLSCSPWLLLLSILVAPLAGAWSRRTAQVELTVSRCQQHLDRRDLPRLWTFGPTLSIRTGDAEVVKSFRHPERLSRRKRDRHDVKSRHARSVAASPPTASVPLSETTNSSASLPRAVDEIKERPLEQSAAPSSGELRLQPRDVVDDEPTVRRCPACGNKLLPQESACRRCQMRQAAPAQPQTARAAYYETDDDDEADEPLTMWSATGKLVLSLTELALATTLFCILGAGAVYFAQHYDLLARVPLDWNRLLLTDRGMNPLAAGAMYFSAGSLMLYYGATGLAFRNGLLAGLVLGGLAWYFPWPGEWWRYAALGVGGGLALGVLQAMFESRFAEPLGVLFAPGSGLLPGRPSRAGLVALAKGVMAGGFCGLLLGAVVSFPVYLYGRADGWDVGPSASSFVVRCSLFTAAAMAYLAGQFAVTKAEQIGAWRGMYVGAVMWAFCSLIAATAMVGIALVSPHNDQPWWRLATVALLIVAGATLSGGLVGLISGAAGGKRGRVVIRRLR